MMQRPSLYQFFRHQVNHGFHRDGIVEPATIDYVSDILTRFAEARQFHALRDAEGRALEYLVDMLERWQQDVAAGSGRGCSLLRHLGEYTLFMSGIFRERLLARGELSHYLAHGRSAYWRCADGELNPRQRRVYRHLHQDFGRISDTLDSMRREQFPLRPSTDNMLTAFWRV